MTRRAFSVGQKVSFVARRINWTVTGTVVEIFDDGSGRTWYRIDSPEIDEEIGEHVEITRQALHLRHATD